MKKIVLLLFVIFVSCGDKKEEVNVEPYTNDYVEQPKDVYYYDKKTDSILNKIGLEQIRDISQEDIDLLLKVNAEGFFDKKNFCDLYKESKIYDYQAKYKECDALLSELKKKPKLWDFFAVNGHRLCPLALMEAKEYSPYNNRSNEYYEESTINPCVIAIDFIKQDLYNPSTLDYSLYDCTKEQKSDGSYVILRKISAKNSLGAEKEYIYKVTIGYKGGGDNDVNNWKLISIQSEEYK